MAAEAARGAGRFGGSLQQVGFQIGDFATQVGAGTSAAQALGQQLPQLLGAFGTFGALAGAGAAILIPLGAALFKMASDTETAEESIKSLTEATDAYSAAAEIARSPIADLREEYGDLADEIQRVSGIQSSFLGELAKRNLEGTAGLLSEAFGGLSSVGDFRGNSQAESDLEKTMRNLRNLFDGNRDAAGRFATALNELDRAEGPEAVIIAVEKLQSIINDFTLAGGEISPELQSYFSDLKSLTEQAAKQVESGISAQEQSHQRLVDEFDAGTQKLKSLADICQCL